MTRTRGKNGDKKATQINIFRVIGLPIKVSTKFRDSFQNSWIRSLLSPTAFTLMNLFDNIQNEHLIIGMFICIDPY